MVREGGIPAGGMKTCEGGATGGENSLCKGPEGCVCSAYSSECKKVLELGASSGR